MSVDEEEMPVKAKTASAATDENDDDTADKPSSVVHDSGKAQENEQIRDLQCCLKI